MDDAGVAAGAAQVAGGVVPSLAGVVPEPAVGLAGLVAVAVEVLVSGLVRSAAGVSPGGHGGGQAVVGAAGVFFPRAGAGAAAVVGVAGAVGVAVLVAGVVDVLGFVLAGTHGGVVGGSLGVAVVAGVGSVAGFVDGRLGRDCDAAAGVTDADGVDGAVAGTTDDALGDAGFDGAGFDGAGFDGTGDGTGGGVTAGASGGDSTVANEWRTFAGSGDRGIAGAEDTEVAEPLENHESKPGATTPMSGICSGPASSGKSRAAMAPAWCEDDVLSESAAGSTVVWEMARSDATVSAVAPAPSTEGACEPLRWRALCLAMEPLRFPERASLHPEVVGAVPTTAAPCGSGDPAKSGAHSPWRAVR